MKKILLIFITILIFCYSSLYAEQMPPIKDVCIYPIYTSQNFTLAWDFDSIGEWIYEVSAVHFITGEIIQLLSTPNKNGEMQINKSGLWELKVRAVDGTSSPYASTLNEDTCIVDGIPQKWVIYTSPEPPGVPIIE